MEFFRIVPVRSSEAALQATLDLASQATACASISLVEPFDEREGHLDGVWGEFLLRRSEIMGGVRFELVTCPNALQWTITTGFPPAPEQVVVHATINRPEQSPELVASLEAFVDDLQRGLPAVLQAE